MNIDIQKIASLAKLEIEPEKVNKFAKDMEKIVDMVNDLPDVGSTEEKLDPEYVMKLRDDVVVPDKFTRDELLKNAPKVESGCIVVPKTVEE